MTNSVDQGLNPKILSQIWERLPWNRSDQTCSYSSEYLRTGRWRLDFGVENFSCRLPRRLLGIFPYFAKFVLTQLSAVDFPLLQFLTGIILILPFATADCERAFSAMNRVKSKERSRLKEILNDLLLLYDVTNKEKATIDINKLARELLSNVWKYKKKTILPPEIQRSIGQGYRFVYCFVCVWLLLWTPQWKQKSRCFSVLLRSRAAREKFQNSPARNPCCSHAWTGNS